MINRTIKGLEKLNRLKIPTEMLEFIGIKPNEYAALCQYEDKVSIRAIRNLKGCKVIAIVKLDEKSRFVYPKYLLKKGKEKFDFEIYILDGELLLEEIED